MYTEYILKDTGRLTTQNQEWLTLKRILHFEGADNTKTVQSDEERQNVSANMVCNTLFFEFLNRGNRYLKIFNVWWVYGSTLWYLLSMNNILSK